MGIRTFLYTCYPLLNKEYLNIVKVFSISIGIRISKEVSLKGVSLDLNIYFIHTRIAWKNFSIWIYNVFFCPKNLKLYIAVTFLGISLAGNYMFKVNNRNTRTRCEICSKLTICQLWTHFTPCSSVSIVNFEQVNAGWVNSLIVVYWV